MSIEKAATWAGSACLSANDDFTSQTVWQSWYWSGSWNLQCSDFCWHWEKSAAVQLVAVSFGRKLQWSWPLDVNSFEVIEIEQHCKLEQKIMPPLWAMVFHLLRFLQSSVLCWSNHWETFTNFQRSSVQCIRAGHFEEPAMIPFSPIQVKNNLYIAEEHPILSELRKLNATHTVGVFFSCQSAQKRRLYICRNEQSSPNASHSEYWRLNTAQLAVKWESPTPYQLLSSCRGEVTEGSIHKFAPSFLPFMLSLQQEREIERHLDSDATIFSCQTPRWRKE